VVELERWTDALAGAFGRRRCRPEPNDEDRLAASICMATVEQIGREWREVDEGATAGEIIRKVFATTRMMLRDGATPTTD
jgi:hypothetical protein